MRDQELTGRWTIDPIHSRIGFNSRHAMVTKVRGAFNDIAGEVVLDPENPSASYARVTMQTASNDTRNADRDRHLISADFFDAERFPQITFVSTSIDEIEDNSFIVVGDLTIRDVTKQISIPLALVGIDKDGYGQWRAGLEGNRRIDRREWDVRWNSRMDSGGLMVIDKVVLEFDLSLVMSEDQASEHHQGEHHDEYHYEGEHQPHEGGHHEEHHHEGEHHQQHHGDWGQ